MKIAVIGCGAMGSIYAAFFAEAGHEVLAIDPYQAHVEAINSTGLRIDGPVGSRTASSITAAPSLSLIREKAAHIDLFILATKAGNIEAAGEQIAPFLGPESLVLTIQNGLGAAQKLAAYIPASQIMVGVADGFGARMVGPGHIEHAAMKLIRIGEMAGGLTARLQNLSAVWQEAGFSTEAFADIHQLIWEKFLCNVTFSGPCTVFGVTVGELMQQGEHWQIALCCTKEAYAVGLAEGINFRFDDPAAYVQKFGAAVQGAKPSMLQDHQAQKRSEISFINGMVPVLGKKHGIETPYNRLLCAVIRNREEDFPIL